MKPKQTKFFKTHFAHADKGSANVQYIYISTCIIQINFVLNLNRGQSLTSRELNLPFQMPSFLYHRVYASSIGYKYNELKCLILHSDEFGETWRLLPIYAGMFTHFPQSGVFLGAGAATVKVK